MAIKQPDQPAPDARVLDLYTVYTSPNDYPDKIVVRSFRIGPGVVKACEEASVFDTLEQARTELAALGLYRIDRQPDDDPAITEVWL